MQADSFEKASLCVFISQGWKSLLPNPNHTTHCTALIRDIYICKKLITNVLISGNESLEQKAEFII